MTKKQKVRPGTCQFCGCTEDDACLLDSGPTITCWWVNRGRTVCSNPKCIRRARKEGIPIQGGLS